jgi:twitching motility protein PilT
VNDVLDVLRKAVETGASDVVLSADCPPCLRVHGELTRLRGDALTAEGTKKLVYGLLNEGQVAKFERDKELDFSFTLEGRHRFRGNVYFQRGSVAAVFRLIPAKIPALAELSLPAVIEEFALAAQGLVLVTGPTGHGKSTTQAAMIDLINHRRKAHVITIEDPIEFLHGNVQSVVEQREVGDDTHSFARALKHVLREAPDVILVGEMRDPESIACALSAAETGHLVIATVHTNDAVQAVDRLLDSFPPHQQPQVRSQMSLSLLGVVAQRLLPRKDGSGRVPAVEVLRNTAAVAHLIREGKTHQLYAILETNAREGMKTLDGALKELYLRGAIEYEEARKRMRNPSLLERG